MSEQCDLFDLFQDEPLAAQLMAHIDHVPAGELEATWPRSVVELVDVLENELQRQGVAQPREIARRQVLAVAWFMGGRQYYIPRGDTITTALRDDLIYCRHNGRNTEELRREFRLSQPQIYHILARQRKLHLRRRQADLFDDRQ